MNRSEILAKLHSPRILWLLTTLALLALALAAGAPDGGGCGGSSC